MTLSNLSDLPTGRRFKTITNDVFGLTYRIRSLVEREKTRHEYLSFPKADKKRTEEERLANKVELIALCLCDEDGNPTVTKPEQKAALYDVDSAVTGWLYGECRDHCYPESPESVEDAKKNSEKTGDSSSRSD